MAGKKYTRGELMSSVAEKTGMSQKDVRQVMDCILGDLKAALIKRKIVELRGFGTFKVKARKGRKKARNPRTGEIVSVGAHSTVIFRPGRALKQEVWNLGEEAPCDGSDV
ncbi:MAG: integration host factor subunit beta [Spirochaetaceae bacterium]|jgi:integration host factor subunit beta|nr:integration host factor subunit beta [Spirochaetaceae bacterium]